jgi:hypothetical protein
MGAAAQRALAKFGQQARQPQQPTPAPTGIGARGDAVFTGIGPIASPAGQAEVAGARAAATAAATARVKEKAEQKRAAGVLGKIEGVEPPGLRQISPTGEPILPDIPLSPGAQKFLEFAGGDVELAGKMAELNKKVAGDDKAKQGIRSITVLLPKILGQIEKVPVSDVRPFGPKLARGATAVKEFANLLPEARILRDTFENIATPFARALGDTRVSDADAARALKLLEGATFSGDAKVRKQNIDNLLTLIEGQAGVDIRGFIKLKRKQAKQGKQGQRQNAQDKQAVDWALDNPEDPRAVQILDKLGIRVTGEAITFE